MSTTGTPRAAPVRSGAGPLPEAPSDGGSFGRMEPRTGSAPMAEINMTPLIDVMLVLLVIFMITAPLMVSTIKVDLPQASASAAVDASVPPLAVTMDQEGGVYVRDQPLSGPALERALRAAAEQNPGTEVQLRADSTVPYGRVVEFMAVAHGAGLSRVGFVAQAPR